MTKQEAIAIVQRNAYKQIKLFEEYCKLTKDCNRKNYEIALPFFRKAMKYYKINNKLIMKHNIVVIGKPVVYFDYEHGKYQSKKIVYIPI